jgi:hypothetical protein
MMLNGWQRLWVVATVLWVAWMARQFSHVASAATTAEALAFGLRWAAGPPAVVYVMGIVAAWVARGFREPAEGGRSARSS